MFSAQQKRQIADAVQRILRETSHPELPHGEINFLLHVEGVETWSWADIRNNGAVTGSMEWGRIRETSPSAVQGTVQSAAQTLQTHLPQVGEVEA
jgi:hypothetical protein